MSNIIDYTINKITNSIPAELLVKAFQPDRIWQRRDMINTHWVIRTEVIEKIVLNDLNVLGGEHVEIPLDRLTPTVVEGAYLYTIPLSMTNGRHISRFTSMSTGLGISSGAGNLAERVLYATESFESNEISDLKIVGPNTFITREALVTTTVLYAVLNYDQDFVGLEKSYWLDFSHLCTVATEMYVYNKLAIKFAGGSDHAGQPNSVELDLLSEMRDAKVRYKDLIDTLWSKIPIMADHNASMQIIKMSMGAYD